MKAIKWLAEQRRSGYVDDVLVLANHPLRLGIDSPHEMRDWRDAAPEIMIGMEGAPGAQGAAIPGWRGATSIRGEYENKPSAQSWPGYPAEAYLTYGGFDWSTATVGGLWDAMLAEGRLFSITTNSDAHRIVFDTWKNGDWPAGQNFDNAGKLPDPVNTDTPQPGSDFWPGQFSRTHVGVHPVCPHRLPRGDGGPARGPRLARPRPSARRPRRPREARPRPRPGRHPGRPAAGPQGREAHPGA